ncbi:MAG TPA: hypothetical protein VK429_02605 [Patescibacteria group bacterium]|nr:hypothetical protein [Patescibacteria group bacterium]
MGKGNLIKEAKSIVAIYLIIIGILGLAHTMEGRKKPMATEKQKEAAKNNIKKAQAEWKAMSSTEHARSQPKGRARKKPGTTEEGKYYRIVVRSKEDFVTFRYHDVGEPGGIQRLAGKRSSGSWDDQAWLISKEMAHMEGNTLVADTPDAKKILQVIGPAKHVKGDIFQGHPRKNVPEREKPTPTQRRARMENIRKAQQARQK